MKLNPFRLVLDTVTGQVVVLIVLSIMVMHGFLTLQIFWMSTEGRTPRGPGEEIGQTTAYVRVFANAPPALRPAVVEAINKADDRSAARIVTLPAGALLLPPDRLVRDIGGDVRVFAVPRPGMSDGPEIWGDLYFQTPDGTVLYFHMSRWEEPPVGPGVFTLIFLAIATTLMVGWTTFVITRPLRRFAAAVENFRDMRNDDVIVEDGPAEIRAAIAAFNRMRTRIGKLMADRTAMLAAVSHDLRTPITRLRLRAEFIEDAGQRGPFLADLDHMADLTQAALRHLSTAESRDPYEATDLPSLMQTIADQYGDMGHDVAYAGPERFTARVRLRDMQRAITNLVDNAIRFGQHVALSLETVSGTRLDIVVADDGPGIPPEERRRLIEPFQRGNSARTSESGAGFGLGLAIARDIAEAHGGELRLEDNTPQGLRAVISIAVK